MSMIRDHVSEPGLTTGRILLVDDDLTSSRMLAEALADIGYDVVLFTDGTEGLVRATSDYFPLILIAAELPGMNGFRFCNRIKKDPNATRSRVFLMAEQSMKERFAQHERLSTRADAYFLKPIDPGALIAQARALVPSMSELVAASRPRSDLALDEQLATARAQHITLSELRTRVFEQEEDAQRLLRDLATEHTHAETRSQQIAYLQCRLDELTPLPSQLDAQIQAARGLTTQIATLERDVAGATESIAKERASHATELAELKSVQDAAGAEGEARLAAMQIDHTEITSALCQMHASEVTRIRQGSEEALGVLRRGLAQSREQAEALAGCEERRVRDLADAAAAKQEVEWLLGAERDARAVAEVGRARAQADQANVFRAAEAGARIRVEEAQIERDHQLRAADLRLAVEIESSASQVVALTRAHGAETSALRAEHDALEAEITALRMELTNLRTKLASDGILARAAAEQLENNRRLLDRAAEQLAHEKGGLT